MTRKEWLAWLASGDRDAERFRQVRLAEAARMRAYYRRRRRRTDPKGDRGYPPSKNELN